MDRKAKIADRMVKDVDRKAKNVDRMVKFVDRIAKATERTVKSTNKAILENVIVAPLLKRGAIIFIMLLFSDTAAAIKNYL